MRLHRFYFPEAIGNKSEVIIDNKDVVNQVRKVFRLKKGDLLVVFDGSGSDYTCGIEDFRGDSIVLGVREATKSRFMPEKEITLCMAVVKKDNFEWIVEKATELGVAKIIPIIAERTEKKALNEERLKKIAVEASEQSGRGNVPTIHPIITFKESVEWVNENGIDAVAFHTDGEILNSSARADLAEKEVLEIFIGPEGGWSQDEIALFHDNEIPVVSIGKQVLRAETAVVSALSLVMLQIDAG